MFKGKLDFYTEGNENWWAVVHCDYGFYYYYKYWIRKLPPFFTDIVRSKWGPHISVIRGEIPLKNKDDWGKFQGESIDFQLIGDLYTRRGDRYWIWVDSPRLVEIRQHFGLPDQPCTKFHMTIGRNKYHQELGLDS